MSASAYDKQPVVQLGAGAATVAEGWGEVVGVLRAHAAARRCVLAVECYPGVRVEELRAALTAGLAPALVVDAEAALLPTRELDAVLAPFLGGDDPVFGYLTTLELADLFAPAKLAALGGRVASCESGLVLVLGTGATLVAPDADVLVYADLTRWEIQRRQRRHESGNLGAGNRGAGGGELYKRSYFVDWRVADRQRNRIAGRVDHYLDTNDAGTPRLVPGAAYDRALEVVASRPFRLVPFFDPGPWGGEWMRRRFDLPADPPNFAWCFDCVPEENSLLLGFGARAVHSPALPLVHRQPERLLGRRVHERFGAEFPIRFDLLDTWEGGNLSLQVHPLEAYIRERFGMAYTQHESYYLLDAKPGRSRVYLGLRDGVDRGDFERDLRAAAGGGAPFPADRHVRAWPARRHDHFSIPAGTVHCSGADGVVLEISATPYIFTFKLWDWGRTGLDGRPRPTHIDHGLANLQWDRTESWVAENLVGRVREVGRGDGVVEEATGLHPLEFIETRRHWFTAPVDHDTRGTVNVLNLVEGESAVVESPRDAFEPLVVHHAETFVVPASVGPYRIRPAVPAAAPLATIKASVRGAEEPA